jgi:hypothetical protein
MCISISRLTKQHLLFITELGHHREFTLDQLCTNSKLLCFQYLDLSFLPVSFLNIELVIRSTLENRAIAELNSEELLICACLCRRNLGPFLSVPNIHISANSITNGNVSLICENGGITMYAQVALSDCAQVLVIALPIDIVDIEDEGFAN